MNEIKRIKKLISKIGTDGYKDGSSKKKGFLYHPIPFKEFSNLSTHKTLPAGKEYDLISKDIGELDNRKVLEIGCANGYFSFNFSRHCDKVVAYEGDKLVWDVNEAIRVYKGIDNIKFINNYFDDIIVDSVDSDFDVALMLNVHMWIYKQLGASRTLDMIKKLSQKTKVLYFQTAHRGSGGKFKVQELESKEHIREYLYEAGFSRVEHMLSNEWHGKGKPRELFKCIR